MVKYRTKYNRPVDDGHVKAPPQEAIEKSSRIWDTAPLQPNDVYGLAVERLVTKEELFVPGLRLVFVENRHPARRIVHN